MSTETDVKNVEHNEYDLDDDTVSFGRRAFVGGIAGFGVALWALIMGGGPLLSFLWPEKNDAIVLDELVFETKLADFPPGSSKNLMFGSIAALLIHEDSGKVVAYNAKCSHLGCTVQYQKDKSRIFCACHGGTYDPDTGKVLGGPPPKGLDPLVAEVSDDGTITIKRA